MEGIISRLKQGASTHETKEEESKEMEKEARPYVVLSYAQTLDGSIAASKGPFPPFLFYLRY